MRGNFGTVNQGDNPQDWYNSLPIITKILFTLTLLMTCLSSFGIIPYTYFIYDFQFIRYKFEIWRIITGCLFAGSFSFNFAMHLYMLYNISVAYELNPYNTGAGGSSADYLFAVIVGMLSLCALQSFASVGPLSDALLYFLMYVRCRRAPDDIMNLWGFKFKALYVRSLSPLSISLFSYYLYFIYIIYILLIFLYLFIYIYIDAMGVHCVPRAAGSECEQRSGGRGAGSRVLLPGGRAAPESRPDAAAHAQTLCGSGELSLRQRRSLHQH